jgi:hypothetical protein
LLRLKAEECLRRGLVDDVFGCREATPCLTGSTHDRARKGRAIRTILISGWLTKGRLDQVLEELRHIASNSNPDDRLTFVFNSPGGAWRPVRRFLGTVLGEEQTRLLVEQAEIKIYEAHSVAAFLAFTLGSVRELAVDTKISLHVGKIEAQFGNPDYIDQDGRLATWIFDEAREYSSALYSLFERLGLNADPVLGDKIGACGGLELSAQDCLRRGLVNRTF